MLLKVTLTGRGAPEGTDLLIDADPTATVGALASAITDRNPAGRSGGSSPVPRGRLAVRSSPGTAGPTEGLTIRVEGPGAPRGLDPRTALAEAPLRSGDRIAVVAESSRFLDAADVRSAAATLVVREGPDAGQRFALRTGANQAGRERSNEVVLSDPMVSKRHARFNVTDVVEVIDLGSVNGLEVDGSPVDRAILRPGDAVLLGDTVLAVESIRPGSERESAGPVEPFNRSPYLDPVYEGVEHEAPQPPSRQHRQRLPIVAMIAPIVFGLVMWRVMKSPSMLFFMGFSPVMMIGSWWENRRAAARQLAEARKVFAAALDLFDARLAAARQREVARRLMEHPGVGQAVSAVHGRAPMLWARRPDRHSFLDVRLGLGDLPTRSTVQVPPPGDAVPEVYEDLRSVVERHRLVRGVPVVAPLTEVGVVGIAGSQADAGAAARSVIAQLAALHSPAEVVIGALLAPSEAFVWDWLKWLPHTTSDHSPLEVDLVASGPAKAAALAAALRGLIGERTGSVADGPGRETGGEEVPAVIPAVVVLVDDGVPLDRPVLVDLAERGPSAGIFLVWVAPSVSALPAAAEAFLAHDPATHHAMAGYIAGGIAVQPVVGEALSAEDALGFARSLAPVVDAGAGRDESAEIPSAVSFLDRMGLELASSPATVVERWRAGDSLPVDSITPPRSKPAPLHSFVGVGSHGPLQLDLRRHGPHALVGGTTGAGKSEFLQSWILGLAVNHSPARVTFLFVDYKGGAAFSECVNLPHSVGLVTDLTPHLVQRALTSLNAELRHREHILNRKKAKDVLELERLHDPDCPPSLVIVVDEFAALASEVPEFVDGVVNVAQRGRSLGLHLILATQRPAGVIKDNLRANTNLRVALRMADEHDSDDVVGSKVAAGFDPSVPGRGVAKLGPGRLTQFQAAYLGGWTTGKPPIPRIAVSRYSAGGTIDWPSVGEEPSPAVEAEPNDLARLVDAVSRASGEVGLAPPRRPWLPELADTYDIGRPGGEPEGVKLLSRTDERLVFGVLDDPANQRQIPVAFEPDHDGNMAVIGAGGSGKSAFLRTLAVAGALSTQGGPCHVYGLDFASRGLDMLSVLPNVGAVITGDDEERLARLLRTVRTTIDERLTRYAVVKADSITAFRRLAGEPHEPRILVLLDGFPAFRNEYEGSGRVPYYDLLRSIATDGRQAGVHVVLSADRVGAVPSAMSSLIQRWLILRLAGDNEYAMAGVKPDLFPPGCPPGRGWFADHEVQVAVLGGSPAATDQGNALARLGDLGRERGILPAPGVGALPDLVELASLPPAVAEQPVVGVSDDTLGPFAVAIDDPILVAGPPKSGRTTAVVTLLRALERVCGPVPMTYVGEGRSSLHTSFAWNHVVFGGADARERLQAILVGCSAQSETRPQGESSVAGPPPAPAFALVLDDLGRLNSWAESDLLADLVRAAAAAGGVVLADGEVSAVGGSYGLLQAMKVGRCGLILQPDQYDGENLFKTPLPRIDRTQFPPGRGYFVAGGKCHKIQVALP